MCTIWDFSYARCRHVSSELQVCRKFRKNGNGTCPDGPPQTQPHPMDGDCGCGGDAKLQY